MRPSVAWLGVVLWRLYAIAFLAFVAAPALARGELGQEVFVDEAVSVAADR